jgi:predicted Holliday junction resolvase-like endonuclease
MANIIVIVIIILLLVYRYLNYQAVKQALIDKEIQDQLEEKLEEEIQRKIKKKYRKKKFLIDSEVTYIPDVVEEGFKQEDTNISNNMQQNTNQPELANYSSYIPHNLRDMGSYHSLDF